MKSAAAAAALWLTLAPACLAQAAAGSGDGSSPGLFEIRVGRLAPFVVTVLVDAHGDLLLPLQPILAAAGMRSAADTLRSASATSVVLQAADGTTFVDTRLLTSLLGASLSVDTTSLIVSLRRATPFPAEREQDLARREQVRALATAQARDSRSAPWTPRTGGLLLDWRLGATAASTGTNVYAQARVGVAVLGGALTATGYTQSASAPGPRSFGTWSYDFVDPTRRYFRTVRIGDLFGGLVAGRSLEGIAVSNRRPLRSGFFADVSFVPDVPPGWSYEIYQDGRLVDYADGLPRPERVVVPVRYGPTPIEVRAYGPGGEVLVSPLTFMTPTAQLPRGRVEYDVTAGRCSEADCRELAYATVDVGVSNALTLGMGAEAWSDSTGWRETPVARLSYATRHGWELQGDYQPGILERVRAAYTGHALTGTVEGGRSYQRIDPLRTIGLSRDRWFGGGSLAARVTAQSGDGRWWTPTALLANGWLGGEGATVDRWHAGVEGLFRGVSLGVRHARVTGPTPTVTTLSATVVRPFRHGLLKHVPVLTAGVGLGPSAARFLEGTATVELGRGGTISLSGRTTPSDGANRYATLIYSVTLDAVRAGVQVRSSTWGHTSTLLDVGSMLAVGRQGVLLDPTVGAQSAGMSGVVYYDANDDGVFDRNERPATGVTLSIGGQTATTDQRGRFRLWNVIPYEPLEVHVDSLGAVDPAFALHPAARVTRATPNMFNPIEVRLAPVQQVGGQVQIDGVPAPGGVRLRLASPDPRLAAETVTFFDGSYAFERVFPGEYELSVVPSALISLAGRAEAASVTVRGGAPGSGTQGPTIRIYSGP